MQRVSWFLKISGLTLLALIVAIAGLTTGSADAQSATQAATTAATAAKPVAQCYTTAQVSEVRIVHAAVGTAAVDVYMDNGKTPAVSGLAFGKGTDYMQALPGTHQIKLVEANGTKVVATGSATIKAQNAYTLVASGTPVKLTNFTDDASDTAGMARLVVIHVVAGGPAVDVITTKDNKAWVSNLAEGKASSNVNVAAGTYDLAVIKNGDKTNTALLALAGTKLDADTITTLVITGVIDKTGKATTPLAAISLASKSFAGFANPNPTPAPTNTPAPTATKGPTLTPTPKPSATPKPTSTPKPTTAPPTPKPTATSIPPTATPIPVGQSPASLGIAVRNSRNGYSHLNGGKCVEVAGISLAGGPGAVAGLQINDLILGIDGAGVDTPAEFQAIISGHASGDKITLTIQRADKLQQIKVTLGANPFLSS